MQYSAGIPLVMRWYSASTPTVVSFSTGTVLVTNTGPVLVSGTAPVLHISTECRYHAKVAPVPRQYCLVPPVLAQYRVCCEFPLGRVKVKVK